MAGIIASSVSRPMLAAETAADKSVSGYLTNEQITLSTTPTGSNYVWLQTKPNGSTVRSSLSASTGASIVFSPDIEGTYLVTCIVDSTTTYVIRMAAVNVGAVSALGALSFAPLADAQVPTPATGVTVYYSSTAGALVHKDSAGVVSVIDVT